VAASLTKAKRKVRAPEGSALVNHQTPILGDGECHRKYTADSLF